jgi:hypothetical protein
MIAQPLTKEPIELKSNKRLRRKTDNLMKTKLLLITALAALTTTLTAPASTVTIQPGAAPTSPQQAAAVGFTNLVFDDEFTTANTFTSSTSVTSGYNWYFFPWAALNSSGVSVNTGAGTGALAGATGIATIGAGVCIQTVPTYPANGNAIPGTFQHGYFEARIQFNPVVGGTDGWPAFWSFGISAFDTTGGNGYTAENDFFEAFPNGGIGSTDDCVNTLHNWKHASDEVTGTDTSNTDDTNQMESVVGSTESAQLNDGAWHIMGCLWVQTSATTGYVEYYLDNMLIKHNGGVTRFQTGVGTGLTQQELDHMFLIIGGATNWPLNVDWVRVWQGTSGTTAQTLTSFPATLSLSTTQSPYTLPATTSAGLTVAYSVTSGPATITGDALTVTGAGTVVVQATQAGSATYAPFSGSETITVTAPVVPPTPTKTTQTIATFPATLSLLTTQSPYTLPATTSAGLTISYSVTSGPATVLKNVLTISSAGTVAVQATQAGNTTYAAFSGSETVTATAPVVTPPPTSTPTAQTVSNFPAFVNMAPSSAPYTLPAKTSAGLTITYTVKTGPATVSGNTLTITRAGMVVVDASQAGNSTYSPYYGTEVIYATGPVMTTTTSNNNNGHHNHNG